LSDSPGGEFSPALSLIYTASATLQMPGRYFSIVRKNLSAEGFSLATGAFPRYIIRNNYQADKSEKFYEF